MVSQFVPNNHWVQYRKKRCEAYLWPRWTCKPGMHYIEHRRIAYLDLEMSSSLLAHSRLLPQWTQWLIDWLMNKLIHTSINPSNDWSIHLSQTASGTMVSNIQKEAGIFLFRAEFKSWSQDLGSNASYWQKHKKYETMRQMSTLKCQCDTNFRFLYRWW